MASRNQQAVHVEGLAELRRALKDIGGLPLQKQLRGRFKQIGDEVAAEVRTRVPVRTGRARASVKSGVSGNKAYVQEGKATVPYMGWLDFGGTLKPVGGRKNTQVRPRPKGGRYLYPVINAKRGDITAAAAKAFEDTARDLGLK
jgi:hypothetical protein